MAKNDKENENKKTGGDSEKKKALQAALNKIEKDFGKGSIMKLGEYNVENVEVIPTGALTLDYALGVGGLPRGRIIEIYGPESSRKDNACSSCCSRSTKKRWRGCLYRC